MTTPTHIRAWASQKQIVIGKDALEAPKKEIDAVLNALEQQAKQKSKPVTSVLGHELADQLEKEK